MKVLIAEDDLIPRAMLYAALAGWGYDVVTTSDGREAWDALQRPDCPRLAVLDWMMPGLDGPAVCRQLRERPVTDPVYVILLTARDAKADIVVGLEAGANDYVTKPFDPAELRARVRVGEQVVRLQADLAGRVRELEEVLRQVKVLRKLLPMCSFCKKIRNDGDYWQQLDQYLMSCSDVRLSHGICPECFHREMKLYEETQAG